MTLHKRTLGDHLEGPHVVVTGNPIDGLFFYGPFTLYEDAARFAETECNGEQWWVAPLVTEETYHKELVG